MRLCDKEIPPIGMGTWGMGGGFWTPDYSSDDLYVEALRYALSRGIRLFDTAEMYGGGHTEEIVGRALREHEDEVLIVSKVWPNHLRRDDLIRSALASRARLGVRSIDLYLIHWPSRDVPIKESIRAMEELIDMGVIRCMGVSNFDVKLLQEAITSARKYEVVADEVEYNVYHRDPERELIPFARRNNVTIIAYSPLARGAVSRDPTLRAIAGKHNATPVQVALAYLTRTSIPIPKASRKEHIDEIVGALNLHLSDEDVRIISSL